MKMCRIVGGYVIYKGLSIYIDRDDSFVKKKGLPFVAKACSLNGRLFDIYIGKAKSCLGGMYEFAVAVEVGKIA